MDSGTKQKKKNGADQPVSEDIVPLHIQTFLWRQTSSFLRPKIGKMHEASCIYRTIYYDYNQCSYREEVGGLAERRDVDVEPTQPPFTIQGAKSDAKSLLLFYL
uniref:Cation channel complex component UNC80 N-terminal domain-containing protein n=1 Tax=Daphnia galeata TaxID=27404 RepID=A0A8J2WHB0_9CRUS|nr:unnamed protein product [Daphnia galeata]